MTIGPINNDDDYVKVTVPTDEYVMVNADEENDEPSEESYIKPSQQKPNDEYYQSSITSLSNTPSEQTKAAAASGSWFGSIYSWIGYNIFGSTETKATDAVQQGSSQQLTLSPTLEAPVTLSNEKHSNAIITLKNRLANDIERLQEEDHLDQMEHTSTDAQILRALFAAYMRQRSIKQQSTQHDGEKLIKVQKEKRSIHDKKIAIVDDLLTNKSYTHVLGWVNSVASWGVLGVALVGLIQTRAAIHAAAMALASAPTLVTAGALGTALWTPLAATASIAYGALTLLRAVTSSAGIYMKYEKDEMSKNIGRLKQEAKELDLKSDDSLSTMKDLDAEALQMIRMIRKLLDNHTETARTFTNLN